MASFVRREAIMQLERWDATMKIMRREYRGQPYALLDESVPVITDVQTALDLIMTAQYETGSACLAVPQEAVAEAFFSLRTGLAGEILQKFVNYRVKLAILGDFQSYRSKPLQDFMLESNRGQHIFFVANELQAAQKFFGAPADGT